MNEILNFEFNPMLRALLVNYSYIMYEGDAIIDDEHLLMEYNYLKNNNSLHELFDAENLTNSTRHEYGE